MTRVFSVMASGDGETAAARDLAAFVRAWNKHHSSFISKVEFMAYVGEDALFPQVVNVSLNYRDIYAGGRDVR